VVGEVEVSPSTIMLPRVSNVGLRYSCDCLCRSTRGEDLSLTLEKAPSGISARVLTRRENSRSLVVVELELSPSWPRNHTRVEEERIHFRAQVGNRVTSVDIPICLQPILPPGRRP